jgi:hypothetical protein
MDYNVWCAQQGGNTGLPECGPILGKPVNIFFGKKGSVISKAELAVLQKTLTDRAVSASSLTRLYPIGDFGQIDETSTEPSKANLTGYGKEEQLDAGSISYSIQVVSSLCQLKMLAKWDGFNGVVWIADDNGNFSGKRLPNGDLAGLPVKVDINLTGAMWKDAQNMKTVKVVLNLGNPKQLAAAIFAVKYDFDAQDIMGLKTVELQQVDKTVFRVVIPCVDGNIYDDFHAAIAAATWTATNKTNGADIPAVVTENAAQKAFNVSFAAAPLVNGTPVSLSVDLLASASIEGYECSPLSYIYET